MAFTKLKKIVNYAFLPFFLCCPLLPKWDGAADANRAIPSGEVRAAPAPEEGMRAATLSFHSFCQGPCRVKFCRDTSGIPAKACNFRSREVSMAKRFLCQWDTHSNLSTV